jgi:hypothetical protein
MFAIEKGFRIYKENSDTLFIDLIFDAGAPAGTAGETDAAPVGSIYTNSTNGGIWKKIADTSSASDWSELGDVTIDELSWRNEKVRFATGDTIVAGSVDVLALTDNDDMVYGDIAVGEYVIGDVDGTPALFEVTATPGTPNITVAAAGQALADNDTFVVQQYLPDPTGQEDQAIIHFPLASGAGVKIGDINWEFATGINLSSGYTAQNGTLSSADTVESGMEKLDGNQQDIQTTLGVAQGSTNLGAFAAPGSFLLTATETVKSALQKLADYLFGLRVQQSTGITTVVAVDSLAHATYKHVVWHYEIFEEATPANRKSGSFEALTDGTSVDDTDYAKLKIGANFNATVAAVINGANLEFQVTSSTAGVTCNLRRITVN